MTSKVRKVVIPVAGLGTRGLPFTKEVPKEFLPIMDVPAIQMIVEEALDSGFDQLIFVTSRGKQVLEDFFDFSPGLEAQLRERGKNELAELIHKIGSRCDIISIRQKEPRGLGHAVLCAEPVVGTEPFAVCLGDEIFPPWGRSQGTHRGLGMLANSHVIGGPSIVGVMEVPTTDTHLYGVVDLGAVNSGSVPEAASGRAVLRTVEKPPTGTSPSNLAIIGRYLFDSEIFDALKGVRPGVGGEVQLTDGMNALAEAGKLNAVVLPGPRYDVGTPLQYLLAQVDAALLRPHLADRLRAELKERLT